MIVSYKNFRNRCYEKYFFWQNAFG